MEQSSERKTLKQIWQSVFKSNKTNTVKSLPVAAEYEVEGMKFYSNSNQESVEKLKEIILRASKADDFKKVLENAHKEKYTIDFLSGMEGCGWFCLPDKEVALNPSILSAKLVSTLTHELRHGQQKVQKKRYSSPLSCVAENDIVEAEAQAFTAKCMWQLKEKGDAEPWNVFAERYPSVANTFADSKNKNEPENETMTKTFDAWFLDSYKDRYDKITVTDYNVAASAGNFDNKAGNPTIKELIDKYCGCDGNNYFVGDYNNPNYGCVDPDTLVFLENRGTSSKFKEDMKILRKNTFAVHGKLHKFSMSIYEKDVKAENAKTGVANAFFSKKKEVSL